MNNTQNKLCFTVFTYFYHSSSFANILSAYFMLKRKDKQYLTNFLIFRLKMLSTYKLIPTTAMMISQKFDTINGS